MNFSYENYSDIDLTFNIHPVKKDIIINKGEIAVVKALKHLILTNHYEKPFNPDYGSNIRKLLFEPINTFTAATLENEIDTCIKNFEPRVKVKSIIVSANYDYNAYEVSIEFFIENLVEPFTAEFLLYKLR